VLSLVANIVYDFVTIEVYYMSNDNNNNNPFEELQKQFNELFGNSKLKFGGMPTPKEGAFDESQRPQTDTVSQETLKKIQAFNLKPKEIKDYLNRFVIKQDEAKKVLSVAICDHYNHVRACIESPDLVEKEYSKQNILLLGSTGVGKTYLMRTIARLIGVPFVKADATKFSETGYVGSDVEDIVRDLVKAANNNVELAQYGIVYIDEIDKIAADPSSSGRDISGRGVQINLLKLMEDTEVNLFAPNDIMSQMRSMLNMGGLRSKKEQKTTINTRHILFIVSGAFDRLAETIKKRVDQSSIGFGAASTINNDLHAYLQKASSADFIKYGFEPEFIGRLPVRVACESLKKEDLAQILTSSEGSILNQYRADFGGYNIRFDILPEAIEEIARRAAEEKTGARGLLTIFEGIFRPFKFELPSSGIEYFKVTAKTVMDPQGELERLMQENKHLLEAVFMNDIDRFVKMFKEDYGFEMQWTKEAKFLLINISRKEGMTIRALCEALFKNFHHGLKIVQKNTGQVVFSITEDTIRDPERELSNWISLSFKNIVNTDSKGIIS
jgi:ATP-dependent Clp protease ATP-binding subunit ClpX